MEEGVEYRVKMMKEMVVEEEEEKKHFLKKTKNKISHFLYETTSLFYWLSSFFLFLPQKESLGLFMWIGLTLIFLIIKMGKKRPIKKG